MTAGPNPSASSSKLINLNAPVEKNNPLSNSVNGKKTNASSSYGEVSKKVNESVKSEAKQPLEKKDKIDKKNNDENGQAVAEQGAKDGKEDNSVDRVDAASKSDVSNNTRKLDDKEDDIALELLDQEILEKSETEGPDIIALHEQINAVSKAAISPQMIQANPSMRSESQSENASKLLQDPSLNITSTAKLIVNEEEMTNSSEQDLDQELLSKLETSTVKGEKEKSSSQLFQKLLDGVSVNAQTSTPVDEMSEQVIVKDSFQTTRTELPQQQYNGKIHTSMLKPEWGAALQQRVNWLVSQNIQSARIQVDPQELGPIEIKIEVSKDNQTHVVFNSNSGVTREMLEQQLPRLREMLEQQGVDLADVDVRSDSQDQHQFDREDEGDVGQGHSNPDTENSDNSEGSVSVTSGSINIVDDFA